MSQPCYIILNMAMHKEVGKNLQETERLKSALFCCYTDAINKILWSFRTRYLKWMQALAERSLDEKITLSE